MALPLIHTRYNLLEHALSLFSLLYLHRLSPGNGFQRRSFLGFRVYVLSAWRLSHNQPNSTLALLIIPRHGPRREHSFPVTPLVHVRNLLPRNGSCLESQYLPTAVVWLLISRSLTSNGSTRNNIKTGLHSGNACCRLAQSPLPSRLLFEHLKIITTVSSILMHRRGISFAAVNDEHRLTDCENRVSKTLGKIAGKKEELHNLHSLRNRWRVLVRKHEANRALGRPKRRWKNNLNMRLRETDTNLWLCMKSNGEFL
jgi:hypothetical protein